MTTTLDLYRFPVSAAKSEIFTAHINGQAHPVLRDTENDFLSFGFEGEVEVEISCPAKLNAEDVLLQPTNQGITIDVQDNVVRFKLASPQDLSLTINGLKPLFLFSNPLEKLPEESDDVRVFRAGQIYEVGLVEMQSGQTIHIQGGAIVKGAIHMNKIQDATLTGYGILDNSFFTRQNGTFTVYPAESQNIRVSGVTMIQPTRWTFVILGSRNVEVDGIRQITTGRGRDGIDIVSCQDVTVRNCFICTGDDCIAIKAGLKGPYTEGGPDVRNILVEDCRLLKQGSGSAMEIGHELRCDLVENITFRNCIVLAVHNFGSALCINNGEGATVRNVLYDGIRIEHFYEFLVHFRIMKSRYSQEENRGQVRDVLVRNVEAVESIYNPGYSMSIIGGYDPEHTIEGVVFENLRLGGRKITSLDELDAFTRNVSGIEFR